MNTYAKYIGKRIDLQPWDLIGFLYESHSEVINTGQSRDKKRIQSQNILFSFKINMYKQLK